MDTITAPKHEAKPGSKRPHGLILATLLGLGVLCTLVALSVTASAQTTTKGQTPAAPKAPGVPDCGPNWVQVPSPNHSTIENDLFGVAAVSASDIWAVGFYDSAGTLRTLVEHWDGSTWSVVPSPNPTTYNDQLNAVAAVSASDVWAVGQYNDNSGAWTLIEHWDGNAWSKVDSPNHGTDNSNDLFGVDAVSATDVWAVGYYASTCIPCQTLVEHWDGNVWNIVSSPNQGTDENKLFGVAAISAYNVWAVGYYYDPAASADRALVEHWNGTAWSVVSSPSPSTGEVKLLGVAALGPNNIWAVGYYFYSTNVYHTLTEHWDGNTWNVVASPNVGLGANYLEGVATVSANDIWAVGYTTGVNSPLIEHWDGSFWQTVSTPGISISYPLLNGVAAISAGDIWAVGAYYNNYYRTLVAHYNPCPATSTPTRTRTSTPSRTPTRTITPGGPTNTPTSTPPACLIQFTDVPQGSPFYSYVRCLACRNIVGGYNTSPPCTTGVPCFLPQHNVTRGQIAKFISNAAGYQDTIPPTQQTFTDVPPNSTFWLYVERIRLHNVTNGYNSSPPCTTGIPCFLPGNSTTRGQIAKFVSNAANYQDPIPPTQQTFTDVPPSSTFWLYIECAYLHNIASGYNNSPPCTTGVPCFLPGYIVTRGQTAKFISNAFFPNCITP